MTTPEQPAQVSFLDALQARYGAEDLTDYGPNAFSLGSNPKKKSTKTWEMVGMEKTRAKQSQHSKLQVIALKDCGITVAEHSQGELAGAQLHSLIDLSLEGNQELPEKEVHQILAALPKLQFLLLNRLPVPHIRISQEVPSYVTWQRLRRLVLNYTGFQDIAELAACSNLEELHLEGNGISSLGVSCGEQQASMPSFKRLTCFNVSDNALSRWDAPFFVMLNQCFPALKALWLNHNSMPPMHHPLGNPLGSEDRTLQLAVCGRLETLMLSDNPSFTSVAELVHLCPRLSCLRVTYSTLFGSGGMGIANIGEAQGRMLVIAAMPTITHLNNASVRASERVDSELFYLQRALAMNDVAKRDACFPRFMELREKHKGVVIAAPASADSQTYHVLLKLRFRVPEKGCDVERTLESSTTVQKVKSLIRTVCNIEVDRQRLSFWNDDKDILEPPTPLDDDLQTLGYFGVGRGAIIQVVDVGVGQK